MLTRLEVRGFKNLRSVDVEFGPFTCIAGENGLGKSNVFDVIEFLAALADDSFDDAVKRVRHDTGDRHGDARLLFPNGLPSSGSTIDLAVEMLVPQSVQDDLGATAEATTTFLRYELSLGYLPPESGAMVGRLALIRENLKHITKGEAPRHLRFRPSVEFRNAVVVGERRGGPFLSTDEREGGILINVHGDGGSRGRPQKRAAANARRTVLSTTTTNDTPTILAARREMQSWRRLALEPSSLRAPDDFNAPRVIDANGGHLASTLYRIANTSMSVDGRDADAVYASIVGRLADLPGVGIVDIWVDKDEKREVFTIMVKERSGVVLPARSLSEGTLRFLALCVFLEDPEFFGLICMEEPENGVHPASVPAMVELLRDLAVDPKYRPDASNPLRLVLINTHSPLVVQVCTPGDVLMAVAGPFGRDPRDKDVQFVPSRDSWRWESGLKFWSLSDILPYVSTPRDAQTRLPIEMLAGA